MLIFGIPIQLFSTQIMLGLINGAFYAILSLGLAIIFGLLNIVNFAHGAFYMLGAFGALLMLDHLGINYWAALAIVPLVVGLLGCVIERFVLRWIYDLDHLYGMILTFGMGLVIVGIFRNMYGATGLAYSMPPGLQGGFNLGFMYLPASRAFVIVASVIVCLATWVAIEKTRVGSWLRAATEKPQLTEAFGINVPLLITLTYGFGVALAAFAGVLAAPIFSVNPMMGSDLIIVVFAVVVIGGMGSISGAILTGFMLGLVEGLTKVFWPQASSTVIFVIMAIVLLVRPAGLFGKQA